MIVGAHADDDTEDHQTTIGLRGLPLSARCRGAARLRQRVQGPAARKRGSAAPGPGSHGLGLVPARPDRGASREDGPALLADRAAGPMARRRAHRAPPRKSPARSSIWWSTPASRFPGPSASTGSGWRTRDRARAPDAGAIEAQTKEAAERRSGARLEHDALVRQLRDADPKVRARGLREAQVATTLTALPPTSRLRQAGRGANQEGRAGVVPPGERETGRARQEAASAAVAPPVALIDAPTAAG